MNLQDVSAEHLLAADRSSVFEVRLRQSQILRVAGNDAFHEGRMEDALRFYNRSLFHADFEEAKLSFEFTMEHRLQVFNSVYPVYLNLARYSLQQKSNRAAITWCSKVLDSIDQEYIPPSVMTKVYFLRGKAFFQLGEYDSAESDLQNCLDSNPESNDSTTVGKLLTQCRREKYSENKKNKRTWKGLLNSKAVASMEPMAGQDPYSWLYFAAGTVLMALLVYLFTLWMQY